MGRMKLIVDSTTGEINTVPFTIEEEERADAEQIINEQLKNNPSIYPLSDRQLRLGLLNAGILPSYVEDIIKAIEDPIERETAWTWFDRSTIVHWDHPITQNLLQLAGFTIEQAKTMWLNAKNLE